MDSTSWGYTVAFHQVPAQRHTSSMSGIAKRRRVNHCMVDNQALTESPNMSLVIPAWASTCANGPDPSGTSTTAHGRSIRRQVSLIVDIGIAKSQVSHFVRWPRRFEHNESWHHVPVASPLVSISFWFLASCSVSCVRLIFSLLMLATRASISSPSLKCVKWSSTPSGSFIWDE